MTSSPYPRVTDGLVKGFACRGYATLRCGEDARGRAGGFLWGGSLDDDPEFFGADGWCAVKGVLNGN